MLACFDLQTAKARCERRLLTGVGGTLKTLRGLARYAERFGEHFARIDLASGTDTESLPVLDLKS